MYVCMYDVFFCYLLLLLKIFHFLKFDFFILYKFFFLTRFKQFTVLILSVQRNIVDKLESIWRINQKVIRLLILISENILKHPHLLT